MSNAIFNVPKAVNEPVKSYAPHSKEKEELLATYRKMMAETKDIPMYIGGKEVFTENKVSIHPPHRHAHTLGHFNRGK